MGSLMAIFSLFILICHRFAKFILEDLAHA